MMDTCEKWCCRIILACVIAIAVLVSLAAIEWTVNYLPPGIKVSCAGD